MHQNRIKGSYSRQDSLDIARFTRVAVIGAAAISFICILCDQAAAEPLTLGAALESARAQNAEILAARQQLDIARARLQKASYWNQFNPEVEGGAAARQFNDGGSAAQPSGGLSLEVEVAGQRGLRIDEAKRNLEHVYADVEDVERLVIARVKEAYYQALYLARRLDLLRDVEALNRRLSEATARKLGAGEVAKLEANQAAVRYSQSRKEAVLAARDHENAVRELERLLGMEPTGAAVLADAEPVPIGLDESELVDLAMRARSDLKAREAEIVRLDAETRLTRRLVVPNPTLKGVYEEETESAKSRDRIIGGAISIPLPVFDRKQAELSSLAAERIKAGYERSGTALEVKNEVRDAFRSYRAARQVLDLFERDALTPIEENFRFVERSYRAGEIDLLQLIVVQNDLVTARSSYLESLSEYWQAAVALERAVGQPLSAAVPASSESSHNAPSQGEAQ